MAFQSGHPFPSAKHKVLLKACLLKGDHAISSFREWKSMVDFDKDIESGTLRLLPLLYHNLQAHGVVDDVMPRLKGIYRQSWSKNQLLFYQAGKIIQFLEINGINTMVMKGIPLSLQIYRNHAVRPMADIDVLVSFSKARPIIELLLAAGWRLNEPQYLEHNLKYGRSATLYGTENEELDLHWHPVFESHDDINEEDFWNNAIPLKVAGAETRTFCVTDHLFHTIVHGLRYNPEPPVRWIADAYTLVHVPGNTIDWDRLMKYTKKFRVHIQMKEALIYLVEQFNANVPDRFLYELGQIRPAYSNRLVYRHAMTIGDREPGNLWQKTYSVYAGFLRQTNKTGFWSQHIGFIRYMRFRTKGKPLLKILIWQISLIFQSKKIAVNENL